MTHENSNEPTCWYDMWTVHEGMCFQCRKCKIQLMIGNRATIEAAVRTLEDHAVECPEADHRSVR